MFGSKIDKYISICIFFLVYFYRISLFSRVSATSLICIKNSLPDIWEKTHCIDALIATLSTNFSNSDDHFVEASWRRLNAAGKRMDDYSCEIKVWERGLATSSNTSDEILVFKATTVLT
jgi:hypothetical protein